jgi:hypothetical protein
MAAIHPYGIEFIGGPFDGYKHVVDFPPADLASVVTLPVRRHPSQSREAGSPSGEWISAAVYELCNPQGVCSYHYLGASCLRVRGDQRRVG